jgi:hypothetical protein
MKNVAGFGSVQDLIKVLTKLIEEDPSLAN